MIDKFDIEKLRALPIEGVAQRLGLTVSRHLSLCPFHNDRHPSLHFNVSRNTYKCYVCDAHGGPIDLVMRYLNKPFIEACKWLSEGSGIMVDGLGNFPQPSSLNPQPFERSDHYNSKPFDASKYQRFFERPWLNDEARHFLFEERHLDPRVVRYCRLTSWRDRQGTPWLQTPYYDREGHLIGIQNRNLSYGSKSSKSLNSSKGSNPSNLSNPQTPQTSQTCVNCPKLPFVCTNSTLPCWCPMIKPGNGIHNRLDGSILVGQYNCLGSLIHPKTTFDPLYERIRKAISRGTVVSLIIKDD